MQVADTILLQRHNKKGGVTVTMKVDQRRCPRPPGRLAECRRGEPKPWIVSLVYRQIGGKWTAVLADGHPLL